MVAGFPPQYARKLNVQSGIRTYSPHHDTSNNTSIIISSENVHILADELHHVYSSGGTDGVREWATIYFSKQQNLMDAATLMKTVTDTTKKIMIPNSATTSVAPGILNGLLGAVYDIQKYKRLSSSSEISNVTTGNIDELALTMLTTKFDNKLTTNASSWPDLVAHCSVYSILKGSHEERHQDQAELVLQKAEEYYPTKSKSKVPPALSSPTMLSPVQKEELLNNHGIQVSLETNDYIVVSKPSGMVCYHDEMAINNARYVTKKKKRRSHGNGNDNDDSLEDILLQYVPLSTLNKVGRGFVHRIDRGTSGCILLSKTNAMHAQLVTQFFLRRAKKSYLALVHAGGHFLDANVKNGTWPNRGKVELAIRGKAATSSYRVVQRYGESHVALLQVETHQGRKHQVRIHCSLGLQSPILLDPLYGGEAIMFRTKRESSNSILPKLHSQKRFCLHAQTLSIPDFGIDVEAPTPEWWQDVINEVKTENKEVNPAG